MIGGHKQSFNVIIPRRTSSNTDAELRLMLVTLKNTVIASSVHISRIENELRKRGKSSRILSSARANSVSEFEIEEDTGDVKWRANPKEGNAQPA
nr:MAG: hypothetical protein AM325_16020 [Candidatus Thorarchaeota archaeon SMTZ1-45]